MTVPTSLPHRLDRTVTIGAPPERVFAFFTDSARWARWWGAGSTIDARPGGALHIAHPGGIQSAGEVVDVEPPRRLVFTYGFVSGTPIPAGGSLVTITLDPIAEGTRLTLVHEVHDAAARDEHVQGWRFQLSLFANIVADELTANAARFVDLWFDTWAEPDAIARKAMLTEIAELGVRMRDRYSNLEGIEDVLPHIAATHRFMPGLRMRRTGDVRQCQGTVLADYDITALDGSPRGGGTNVFLFGPTGRIASVTGVAPAAPR